MFGSLAESRPARPVTETAQVKRAEKARMAGKIAADEKPRRSGRTGQHRGNNDGQHCRWGTRKH
jgi:hypothetical protein